MYQKSLQRFAVFQLILIASVTLFPVVLLSVVGVLLAEDVGNLLGIEKPSIVWFLSSILGVLISVFLITNVSVQIRKQKILQLRRLLSIVRGADDDTQFEGRNSSGISEFDEISGEIERILRTLRHRERFSGIAAITPETSGEKPGTSHRTVTEQPVPLGNTPVLGGLVNGVIQETNTALGISVTAASFLNERAQTVIREWDEQRLTRDDLECFLKDAEETSRIAHANLSQATRILASLKQVASDQQSDEMREFNLPDYIQDILLALRHRLKTGRHVATLVAGEPVFIKSFPGVLTRVIDGLVFHSIAHSFEHTQGGEITIELRREGSNVIIRYSDNGGGLNGEDTHRLFPPLNRSRSGSGETDSGMNTVYNLIVERLKGSVQVYSPESGGFGCELTFPDLSEDTE